MPATRRPRGSGHKNKDGRWVFRASVNGRSRVFYGQTQAEAKHKAQEAQGAWVPTSSGSLRAYIGDWLEGQRDSLKPQTWKRYEQLMRLHVTPSIGDLPLASVKAKDIKDMAATLARGDLSGTTRRHVHVVLGTALTAAVGDGRIEVSPMINVSAPRNDLVERMPLSVADANRLIEVARGDRYFSLYVLGLTTGMRPGEAMALHWNDIDLDRRTVTVRGNVVNGHNGREIDSPKYPRSRRTITLPTMAVDALTVYRDAQASAKPDDLLFPGRDGKVITATNLSRQHFRPLVKLAGLPATTTLYTLRHTFATNALIAGVPLHTVSAILGHSSSVVTLRHYAHYIAGEDTAAAAITQGLYG